MSSSPSDETPLKVPDHDWRGIARRLAATPLKQPSGDFLAPEQKKDWRKVWSLRLVSRGVSMASGLIGLCVSSFIPASVNWVARYSLIIFCAVFFSSAAMAIGGALRPRDATARASWRELFAARLRGHAAGFKRTACLLWLALLGLIVLPLSMLGKIPRLSLFSNFSDTLAEAFGIPGALRRYEAATKRTRALQARAATLGGETSAWRQASAFVESDPLSAARVFLEIPFDPRWAVNEQGDAFAVALDASLKNNGLSPEERSFAQAAAGLARSLGDLIEMASLFPDAAIAAAPAAESERGTPSAASGAGLAPCAPDLAASTLAAPKKSRARRL